jgi:integrase
MPRRKRGERVLGPYEHGLQWRVVEIAEDGTRTSKSFSKEAQAQKYIELLRAALAIVSITVEDAHEEYAKHLRAKGNKDTSLDSVKWAIRKFFPDWSLRVTDIDREMCAEAYKTLTTTLAVDSHRNALAQIKTFLAWCKEQRYLSEHPAEHIEGIGRRNTGKEQLRVKEARVWYAKAVELADGGDEGAVAALMTLLLGLRASEIVNLKVGDIDTDEAECDLLYIRKGKTAAAKRTLHVPQELRPYLVRLTKDRQAVAYLFGQHWRDWPRKNVMRICRIVNVPEVTAHGMRGLLATLAAVHGQVVDAAAMLGHENTRITLGSYAAPGSQAVSDRKRGLERLNKSLPAEVPEIPSGSHPVVNATEDKDKKPQ